MNRSLLSLLALLCGASAHAQDAPVSDSAPAAPSAVPAVPAIPAIPAIPAVPGELRVDADWIRLPHRTAARLLAETGTAKDMAGLREKVVKLVASGEATRVDLVSSALMEASRQRVENAVLLPHPDPCQPAAQAFFIWPDGRKTPGEQLPEMAAHFSHQSLGRRLETDIDLALKKGRAAYDLFMEFDGHVKDRAWGQYPHRRTWPLFFSQRIQARMPRVEDEWQLSGMLTPQPADETGCMQDQPDRLLIFTRLSGNEVRPAAEVDGHPCIIHVEWIETDLSFASRLQATHSGGENSGALRTELAAHLTDGRATLVESTAVSVQDGQHSAVWSHLSLPILYRDGTERTKMSKSGTRMECEMKMDPNRQHVDVNISAVLKRVHYTGRLSQWQYPEAVETERTAGGALILRSGEPALLATLDPLPHGPNSEVAFRPTRKLLVFVRAIF